jgi:RNA polymerase sigma factor (sigma-70 family)
MMLFVDAKPKWQLTQKSFDELLISLSPNRDDAGEKYLQLRKNLVRFFENRGFALADDYADEVFNRLARKLDAGETFENINTYALGVARFLALEIRKSPANKMSDELPEIPVAAIDEEKITHEKNLQCLEKCLLELPDENRQLIIGYYQGDKRHKIENRQRLGEKLGIPNNALRSRAVRLREKLEDCILGCQKKNET